MPRPRSISDQEILDRALGIIRRQGPAGLTFAILSKETGLAPATLVQRFGSKPKLVSATLHHAWDLLDARTAACDAEAPISPVGAIQMLVALSEAHEADDLADSLLVLREDLRDPLLRARGRRWDLGLSAMLSRRFAQCPSPPADIGHLMLAQWQGIILLWGFAQDRAVAEIVEDGLSRFCAAMKVPVTPAA